MPDLSPAVTSRALRDAVERAYPALHAMSATVVDTPLRAGAWSPKQIIGHLIDSASNNHQRFVRAQFTDDLVFPGYAQEAWVEVQRYHDAPWDELLECWRQMNRQLARVIAAVPDAQASRARHPHNLHQIAWTTVPESEPVTLGYFMRDYVGHLENHLRQLGV